MLKFYHKVLLLVFYYLISCENVYCVEKEYFSSISGLGNLLKTEIVLVNEMQTYVDAMNEHVEALQSELELIKREHLTAARDREGYLNNPVNAYRLIKRLYTDWKTFEENISAETSRAKYLDTLQRYKESLHFPSGNDVLGSATALVRLQETYKLDVSQIASGILNGVKYGTSMSWQDCFLLGHFLYEMRDFNHTIPWLKQSMDMLIDQEYNEDPISLDFIETVAAYHQEMGDFETALNLVTHVLTMDPERAKTSTKDTKFYLQQMITDGVKRGLVHETALTPGDYRQSNEFKLYEQVCRAEIATTPTQQRPLRCRYNTNNVGYRLLQPYKMEELSIDPYIVQFHNVVNDKAIKTIKRLAKPRMSRSQVRTDDGKNETVASHRTSQTAWFEYTEHAQILKLLQHLHDVSGLNMLAAEELQVANYGIGGHYEPHFDFFTDSFSYDDVVGGNRVATGIYYLSDVEEGGGTAFPFLQLLVKPEQGSLLLWYNLHRSQDPDYRTKHAACPVLKGSKWIANIWVRARKQMLERPCGLEPEHEVSLKYKNYD